MSQKKVFDAPLRGCKLDGWTRSTTLHEWRPDGILWYSVGGDPYIRDIASENHLGLTNDPTMVQSCLFDSSGNRLMVVNFAGANQCLSRAHASMADDTMFASDFTLTFLWRRPSGAAGTDNIFSFGRRSSLEGGLSAGTTETDFEVWFHKAGSHAFKCTCTPSTMEDAWHVIQIVRSSDTATLYVDGVAGTSLDVTGLGDASDHARPFYFGFDNDGSCTAQLAYARIDTEALTEKQIQKETAAMLGTGSSLGQMTFSRASVTTRQDNIGARVLDIPSGQPVVGDGMLVSSSGQNGARYSEDCSSWTESGTCAVTTNDHIAPDKSVTADKLDNTGGANTDYRYSANGAVDLVFSNGDYCTCSVWLRADTPHLASIYAAEEGSGATTAHVFVTSSWKRFSCTRQCVADGDGDLGIRVYPGRAGIATGVVHAWGGMIEIKSFPSVYVPTANTTIVDRAADSADYAIPTPVQSIGGSAKNNVLTVEFDCRGLWSAAADLAASKTLLELSGNTGVCGVARNRVRFFVAADGKITMYVYDGDDGTLHSVTGTADITDYSDWFTVKGTIDCGDLSNLDMTVNGSNSGFSYSNNSGTCSLLLSDGRVRLGQEYDSTVTGDCYIRDLKIYVEE